MKRFQILYKGNLAESHLTHVKAKARAFELCTVKGWNVADVKVVEVCACA